jgi:hypothetical protein
LGFGIRRSANVGSLKDFGVTYPEVPVPVSQFLPSQPYSAYDISNCTVGLWPVEVLMTTDEASVIALQQMVALIGMLLLAL